MSAFQVGFATVNINPMFGIGIMGYYVPRYVNGILDDLEASALALTLGSQRVLLLSVDTCLMETTRCTQYLDQIACATGIPKSHIFLSSTHTHTAPFLSHTDRFEADPNLIDKYAAFVGQRLEDAAQLALADRKPAKMAFIQGWAPERIAYIRRYKMKDGSTMTCPPINDPNIDHPIGQLDQRVHMLRFDQEGGSHIILVNYGLHADTIGGEKVSADWPGWMRKTLAKTLDNVKCIFFNGAEGDVGSTHVFPEGGDMNDTEISFDNEMKSPGMARFIGRALAGTILQIYDKAEYVPVEKLSVLHKVVALPANLPAPEDMPRAKLYKQLHEEGRDSEIPYTAMELTTVVAEAYRMCELEHGPESFPLDLMGIQIGPVALIGIPGEPFTEIGVRIKEATGWSAILPCCLTNGSEGYFPMQSAFDEGGYEARKSRYKGGVAESIISGSIDLLDQLQQLC